MYIWFSISFKKIEHKEEGEEENEEEIPTEEKEERENIHKGELRTYYWVQVSTRNKL